MIKKKGDIGFTLIEILIVLSILSIMLVSVVPKMGSSQEEYRLYSFGRSCVMDLRYAQQLSVNTKEEHGIYFSQDNYELRKGSEIIKTVKYDYVSYQQIDGSYLHEIIFKSNGEPYESGKITFKSNSSDRKIYVNVTPETGEVSESWN